MVKKLVLLVVGIMMAALFAGCGNDAPKEQAGKKIQVVTSFNAMAEFTKAIGGDKVEVSTIIPDGVEPHDFELKPENMKQLATAQVFVYTGFGMEPWAKQAIEAAKNDKLVTVVATKGVEAIKNTDPEEIKNNLIKHITHPVRWTEMVRNMEKDGITEFYEGGPDDTLQKIVRRMCPDLKVASIKVATEYLNIL